MTYEDMCRYIVAKEGYGWNEFQKYNKSREMQYTRVRMICFYFAYVFFKNMSYKQAGAIFGKDHATAIHAVSVITNDLKTNVDLRNKINAYHVTIERAIYTNWPTNNKEADEIINNVQQTITQMKRIAEAYCKLTKKKMVDM